MKIIFICGSIEPGKDGVGDYTRRLAAELIRHNHQATIISINDKYVHQTLLEDQQDEGMQLKVLRLSRNTTWTERTLAASTYISSINPEWISLQFVPFSFQRKGLCFSLGNRLKSIAKDAKWHIMFHELWCGMATTATVKEKILGFGQRIVLKKLIKELKPNYVSTSINPYKSRLQDVGLKAVGVIPVFSNISIKSYASDDKWNETIDKRYLNIDVLTNTLNVGFFGAIYPNTELKTLFKYIAKAADIKGVQLNIIICGNTRNTNLIKHLANSVNAHVIHIDISLDEDILNRLFSHIDVAITTTPVDGIGKSGSTAAWLERSIPVLVSGNDGGYRFSNLKDKGVFQISSENDVLTALATKKKHIPENLLTKAAIFYIENLD